MKEKVLQAMREFGAPVNAGKIAEITGIDRKEVDKVVLQTSTIADIYVIFVSSLLTTEDEGLGIEPVTSEFYCFNFHIRLVLIGKGGPEPSVKI